MASDSDSETLALFTSDIELYEDDDDDDDDSDDETEHCSDSVNNSGRVELTRKTIGAVTLTLVQGQIAEEQVDVIVNSTSSNLNLSQGAVSKALLKAGGNSLQQECNTKYPDGISHGDVAKITAGGNLNCKHVYNVIIPNSKDQNAENVYQHSVTKCLTEADSDGLSSIAIPALGTGYCGFSGERAAKLIFHRVDVFANRNPGTSLTDIRLVVYSGNQEVQSAFNSRFRKSTVDRSERDVLTVNIQRIKVTLAVGQFTEQRCDVLVITSTRRLMMDRGSLSKLVSDAAGPSFQQECNQKYPQGIKHGELAVLGPGNIPGTKYVYCVALPRHDKPEAGGVNPKEALEKAMKLCLEQGVKDKVSSMAFAALGSGYLMYPANVSAQVMLSSIKACSASQTPPTFRIRIVMHSDISSLDRQLKAFESECRACQTPVLPAKSPGTHKKASPVQVPGSVQHQRHAPIPVPAPRRSKNDPKKEQSRASVLKRVQGLDLNVNPFAKRPSRGTIPSPDPVSSLDPPKPSIPERNTPAFCLWKYEQDIRPPSGWSHFSDKNTVKQWKIQAKDEEMFVLVDVDAVTHAEIVNLVDKTWSANKVGHGRDALGLDNLGFKSIKVTKVQRVENLNLYEKYANQQYALLHRAGAGQKFVPLKDLKEARSGAEVTGLHLGPNLKGQLYPEVNEMYLFHGTKDGNLEAVTKQGIDSRMASGQAMYGQAVYLAESSTKADQYTDDRLNRQENGTLKMLLVRVCMGNIRAMSTSVKYKKAPCMVDGCATPDACGHEKRYDSIVSDGKWIFREFVVYETSQAYPEFIIHYTRGE